SVPTKFRPFVVPNPPVMVMNGVIDPLATRVRARGLADDPRNWTPDPVPPDANVPSRPLRVRLPEGSGAARYEPGVLTNSRTVVGLPPVGGAAGVHAEVEKS